MPIMVRFTFGCNQLVDLQLGEGEALAEPAPKLAQSAELGDDDDGQGQQEAREQFDRPSTPRDGGAAAGL